MADALPRHFDAGSFGTIVVPSAIHAFPSCMLNFGVWILQADLETKNRQLSGCTTEMERLRQSSGQAQAAAAAAAADAAVAAAARGSALATTVGTSAAAGEASLVALRSVNVMQA